MAVKVTPGSGRRDKNYGMAGLAESVFNHRKTRGKGLSVRGRDAGDASTTRKTGTSRNAPKRSARPEPRPVKASEAKKMTPSPRDKPIGKMSGRELYKAMKQAEKNGNSNSKYHTAYRKQLKEGK